MNDLTAREVDDSLDAYKLETEKRLVRLETHNIRNIRLIWAIFGGMIAVAARAFWPVLFS